jgi:predicted glycoside hydrolase/deacetylase ChbG (UPF0249 family)
VPDDDGAAIAAELGRQLAAFRELTGRDPTHVDSHQHVHQQPAVLAAVRPVADELGVPLRHYCPAVRYSGDFYGQTVKGVSYPAAIAVEALLTILAGLPAGVTELGCHPALGGDIDSMYCSERATEVRTLCDPRVRAAVAGLGIVLVRFHKRPGYF